MKARRFFTAVFAGAVFVGFAVPAAAAPRDYYTEATPIIRDWLYQRDGTCPIFETENLVQESVDPPHTFMIVQAPDGSTYYDDSCGGGTSCVWQCSSTYGFWEAIVFATGPLTDPLIGIVEVIEKLEVARNS